MKSTMLLSKRLWVTLIILLATASGGGAVAAASASRAAVRSNSRKLEVLNDSGGQVVVDWINPSTGQALNYWTGKAGERMHLDSFVNHTFVVRSAGGETNRTATFQVSDQTASDVQVMVVKPNLTLEHVEEEPEIPHNPDAADIVFLCRLVADTAVARGQPMDKVVKDMLDCMETKTMDAIIVKSEELSFQSDLRKRLSNIAENYTCTDANRETTSPLRTEEWTHHGVTRQVGILHDRPSSQIHIVHDFISREECDAVERAAKPVLHRGTVADGKGGSRMSEHRKAWQAGLKVAWDKEASGDPIAAVSRRLLDYANHVTGYNMRVDGQEDLMSIQYFGNGTDDPRPDRYTPHCDGDCDGMPHKTGGRVATMVMYCDVPELGGGTNFQNSNVFVRPKAGAAAFFSYMDPKTRRHEEGFTSHSGCPVFKGTKRIAVQWMRVGVDLENPWDSFDTNTVKKQSLDGADESVDDDDDDEESAVDDDGEDDEWDPDDEL